MTKDELIASFSAARRFKATLAIEGEMGRCLNAVRCIQTLDSGHGVRATTTVHERSADFFDGSDAKFDLVLIDSIHLCVPVLGEIYNALAALNPGGVVVVHDCLPPDAGVGSSIPHGGAWMGDVYKAVAWYFSRSPYLCYTVDSDCGLGVIDTARPAENGVAFPHEYMCELTYPEFDAQRSELLHVVPESYVEAVLGTPEQN